MTHPPAGPSTPPPPSGPRAVPNAAAVAGSYGRSAEPMGLRRRVRSYWLQNGHEKALTPRQNRRAEHKARHALAA